VRTKIGIVYDIVTGQIRRIIFPDEDHQLAAHAKVNYDEGFIIETYTGPTDPASINAIVQRHTGKMLS
jgi:hypothetical protein